MKGIILAGGSGTRLYPITEGTSKQLLHVYDKPMIYYPLSILMLAGIKDILLITTKEDQPGFKRLFGTGEKFGVNFEYVIQNYPEGLAQAFVLGADFIKDDTCAMILGDNIFLDNNLLPTLKQARQNAEDGYATIFGCKVNDPERYGIMEVNDKKILSIEEKPLKPKSDFAITGLYFYDNRVVEKAFKVDKSPRGEYEITDLNRMYLQEERLKAEFLANGSWFDTGLTDSILEASNVIKGLQQRSGTIISCPEQIAYMQGWITDEQLLSRANLMEKNKYGEYLMKVYRRNRI